MQTLAKEDDLTVLAQKADLPRRIEKDPAAGVYRRASPPHKRHSASPFPFLLPRIQGANAQAKPPLPITLHSLLLPSRDINRPAVA